MGMVWKLGMEGKRWIWDLGVRSSPWTQYKGKNGSGLGY